MKKILVLAALLAIVAVAGAWQGGKSSMSPDDGVKSRWEAFAAAWNKHDAAAMAACWTGDGDLINPFGRIAKGRTAVEALFKDEHAMTFKDSHISESVQTVRTLGDGGIAMVDSECTITGAKNPDGSAMPPRTYHVAMVMSKAKDGKWWFEAARPYAFLTPPEMPKPSAK